MDRFICRCCGEGFGWPVHRTEPETGETHLVSPCCHGGFYEAARCEGCGRLIPAEEGRLCSRCRAGAVERFRLLLDRFTPEEREAINDAYDGVALTETEGEPERRGYERI